jgi:hypothetical protein
LENWTSGGIVLPESSGFIFRSSRVSLEIEAHAERSLYLQLNEKNPEQALRHHPAMFIIFEVPA